MFGVSDLTTVSNRLTLSVWLNSRKQSEEVYCKKKKKKNGKKKKKLNESVSGDNAKYRRIKKKPLRNI